MSNGEEFKQNSDKHYDSVVDFINEEWVPIAVQIGMGCDEFYSLNPKLFKRYRKFYERKLEESRKRLDEQSWMDGIYVAHAIGATFSKNGKYPKKPQLVKFDGKSNETSRNSGDNGGQQGSSDADLFAAFAMKYNVDHFGKTGFEGMKNGKTK